jgi:hypothetical protein
MSEVHLVKTATMKTVAAKTAPMTSGAAQTGAMRHRQVMLGRFATWIRFAGAVGLQAAVMLLCFRAVGPKFGAAGVILPAAIAILGVAMIYGGRYVALRNRPAFAVRSRLRLVGESHPKHGATTRRSAA